jgi:hypothetical protein
VGLVEHHDRVFRFGEFLYHVRGELRIQQIEVVEDYDVCLLDGLACSEVGTLHTVFTEFAEVLHCVDPVAG